MRIIPLAHCPDAAPVLARWHFDEWRDLFPEWSPESVLVDLRTHTDPDRIPTTLVAVSDRGEAVGSVSLLAADLPGYEHLTPWLASLYVRADARRAGAGGALLAAAVREAGRLGVGRLYLFTPHHEGYYAARGWSVRERATAAGRPVAIMSRQTDA